MLGYKVVRADGGSLARASDAVYRVGTTYRIADDAAASFSFCETALDCLALTAWQPDFRLLRIKTTTAARVWTDGRRRRATSEFLVVDDVTADADRLLTGTLVDENLRQTFRRGLLHSVGGQPARIETTRRGVVRQWATEGVLDRDDDLPAQSLHRNGRVLEQIWARRGRRHRDDGGRPAVIRYDGRGHVTEREWWTDGELIRSA
jgi:hypothetical protein